MLLKPIDPDWLHCSAHLRYECSVGWSIYINLIFVDFIFYCMLVFIVIVVVVVVINIVNDIVIIVDGIVIVCTPFSKRCEHRPY